MRNMAIVFLLAVFVNGAVTYANNMGHDDPQPPAPPSDIDGPWGAEADPEWITWAGGFEGDMMLTDEQLRQLNDSSTERNALRTGLWPGAEIPYTITGSFSSNEKNVIIAAFKKYADTTCINFREKTSGDIYYLNIIRGRGCYSYVGKYLRGGQPLSIGSGCGYQYIVEHELMHAVGFYHEQSRYDRDNYVKIHWENIREGREGNFNKQSESKIQHLGEQYDYSSVMHYRATAFTKNGQNTIERLQGSGRLGNSIGLSETDKKKLNKLYKCDATTTTKTTAATTTTPSATTTTPTTAGCVDRFAVCIPFETVGFCQTFSDFMHVYCRKSCDKCVSNCTDDEKYVRHCPYWANEKNYCTTGPYTRFMSIYCKKSCNMTC